jgi:myo-inositol-1(or 4)-monophosphatase
MPQQSELSEILQVAVAAATSAGVVIREAVNASEASRQLLKGLNDVVTETDRRAQEAIETIIRREFPQHLIIGEETHDGVVEQTGHGYRWIIDPIDGTLNFVHRFAPYAVSIGVMCDAEFVAGVVLNVPAGELFTSTLRGGAYVNGDPIRVSRETRLSASLIATGFPERSFEDIDRVLAMQRAVMQRCRGLRRPGAASVDLANLACGRVEGFYERGLSPWDIAAGVLLVSEAGGRVSNYHDGDELFQSRTIVATNGNVHAELLSCIQLD